MKIMSGEQMKYRASAFMSPSGFRSFIFSMCQGGRVLDVGCGNNSPYRVKSQRPDVYYIGLDVGDYNQTRPQLADRYVVVPPHAFAEEISKLNGTVDAVISSHNIEHCDDPLAVIMAIASALKPGGRLYMSFPSEPSTSFPRRGGCLNFFDDPTHHKVPDFDGIQARLIAEGFVITSAIRQYRPPLLWVLGALLEPISRIRRHIVWGTWSFYGFESVIWAQKN